MSDEKHVPERWRELYTTLGTPPIRPGDSMAREAMEELGAAEQRIQELERRALIAEKAIQDRFKYWQSHLVLAEHALIAEGAIQPQQKGSRR